MVRAPEPPPLKSAPPKILIAAKISCKTRCDPVFQSQDGPCQSKEVSSLPRASVLYPTKLTVLESRRKISKDPNNTRWTRNSTSFGQKILRSQGWTPGQYLGAKDAPHAELHTAANASYVRVVVRQDNLGLGANQNQGDECTGLDAFKDLLGRLNGKSEEVIGKERSVREAVKLSLYAHRKYGAMRFIRGGLLVGEDFQPEENQDTQQAADETEISPPTTADDTPQKLKQRKSKKRKARADIESGKGEPDAKITGKKKKKEEVNDNPCIDGVSEQDVSGRASSKTSVDKAEAPEQATSAKKEKKSHRRGDRESGNRNPVVAEGQSARKVQLREEADSGPSSEAEVSGRHLARRRFIAQKRLAVMDKEALKQVSFVIIVAEPVH